MDFRYQMVFIVMFSLLAHAIHAHQAYRSIPNPSLKSSRTSSPRHPFRNPSVLPGSRLIGVSLANPIGDDWNGHASTNHVLYGGEVCNTPASHCGTLEHGEDEVGAEGCLKVRGQAT